VLFADSPQVHIGVGAYRDRDIAMMRMYAAAGAVLQEHKHQDEHEWIGVISGKIELHFTDNDETVILITHDVYHVLPGRPHFTTALEDTYAWTITIPPASGYPTVQSCPMAASAEIRSK